MLPSPQPTSVGRGGPQPGTEPPSLPPSLRIKLRRRGIQPAPAVVRCRGRNGIPTSPADSSGSVAEADGSSSLAAQGQSDAGGGLRSPQAMGDEQRRGSTGRGWSGGRRRSVSCAPATPPTSRPAPSSTTPSCTSSTPSATKTTTLARPHMTIH